MTQEVHEFEMARYDPFLPLGEDAAAHVLRDRFAGLALAGLLSGSPGSSHSPETTATRAYAYADAMLAARSAQS